MKFCLPGARPVGRTPASRRSGTSPSATSPGRPRSPGAVERRTCSRPTSSTCSRSSTSRDAPAHRRGRHRERDGRAGGPAGVRTPPDDAHHLYPELDGTFPNHPADPIDPANRRDLDRAVRERRADIGLAFDGDADRVFLVDERAEGVSGSEVTALVAAAMLERHPGATVVYNLICSWTVPEVIREHGGRPIRTRVGPLLHQAGDGRDGRHLRRRALRPLLLPGQLPRRLGAHRGGHGARASSRRAAEPLSEVLAPFHRYRDSRRDQHPRVTTSSAKIEELAVGLRGRAPGPH